jgi:type VI secretion system secreted protein Hcp
MPLDTFLKLDGILGESLDDKHKGEIDVQSFSWGVNNGGSMAHGSGGGDGKGTFQQLTFIHQVDKSSPALWLACTIGSPIKEARLTSRKSGKGQQEFLVLKLTDVTVSCVHHIDGPNHRSPGEEVTLDYGKLAFEYKPQKADGQLDAGINFNYDVMAQKQE